MPGISTRASQRPCPERDGRVRQRRAGDVVQGADTLALEAEIDRLVYDLYGLTETERAAVGE